MLALMIRPLGPQAKAPSAAPMMPLAALAATSRPGPQRRGLLLIGLALSHDPVTKTTKAGERRSAWPNCSCKRATARLTAPGVTSRAWPRAPKLPRIDALERRFL